MNNKCALIVSGGMASLVLSACTQLMPAYHPEIPLSPGALDGRVRGVLNSYALALDRSAWPCLMALPQEVVTANNWFVVDYRLPTDPHRQQGIAKEVALLPISVGDHVEVFPGDCQRGELARIGAILAAEPLSAPAKAATPATAAEPGAKSASTSRSAPVSEAGLEAGPEAGPEATPEAVTESVSVPALESASELEPLTPLRNVSSSSSKLAAPK